MGRISNQTFVQRRKAFMAAMAAMDKESIAIIPSAPERVRSRDVNYRYRPDSDLYYLTGFMEPEAVLVLIPERQEGEFILFCREKDPKAEVWDGRRFGLEGALTEFGANQSYPTSSLDTHLPTLLEGKEVVHYPMGRYETFDQQVLGWVNQAAKKVRKGVSAPHQLRSSDATLHEMRLIKDDEEQTVMKEAAEISAQAHIRAMQCCRPGMFEYQLEAEYLYHFLRSGCQYPAYPTIVGGGDNANILHYIDNTDELVAGDLVLIDAGGELEGYAADITRTFPVNGRFTPEQKAVYECVLAAQLAAIEQVKPGNHWNQPHEAAVRVLTEGLVQLGLLEGEVDQLIKDDAYRKFYLHNTGHWLGLDVHDVGKYRKGDDWRLFEPGMVLTVEPGLYIPKGCDKVDSKWQGIGVRIEDNLLVTETGHDVLTRSVPKTVDDIEKLMA